MMNQNDPYQRKTQAGGGGFADVSRYLTQNQAAGDRMASKVGQQAVDAGNKARESLSKVQSGFNQAVNSSTVPYNEGLANRAVQNPMSFYNYPQAAAVEPAGRQRGSHGKGPGGKINVRQATPAVATTPANPITPVNQADIDAFTRMRTANYAGPNDLTAQAGYQQAVDDAAAAQGLTDQLGTNIGRQDVLSGLYGGAPTALDSMFLGTGNAQSILNQAGAGNAEIGDSVGAANEKARLAADQARTTNQQTADKVSKLGEPAFASLRESLSKKQRGGGPKRKQNNLTQQQMLDALNRLYGVV